MKQEKWGLGRLLRFRIRHAVRRYPELYIPISRWRYKPYVGSDDAEMIYSEAVGKYTDVVIEGPPRCGNTFAVVAFQLAQPQPARVAHHLHAAAQIIMAAKKDIPAMVLLRDPEECTVSRAASFSVPIELAIRDYIRFYTDIMPYRDQFVVADFPTLTSDYGTAIRALNDRFGTAFEPFEHSEENVARCFDVINEYYRREAKQPERTVARPSKDRQRKKEDVRSEFQAENLAALRAEASYLYNELASAEHPVTPRS